MIYASADLPASATVVPSIEPEPTRVVCFQSGDPEQTYRRVSFRQEFFALEEGLTLTCIIREPSTASADLTGSQHVKAIGRSQRIYETGH